MYVNMPKQGVRQLFSILMIMLGEIIKPKKI